MGNVAEAVNVDVTGIQPWLGITDAFIMGNFVIWTLVEAVAEHPATVTPLTITLKLL